MVLYRRLYFQEETMENDDLKNIGRESDLPKELSEYLMKNHPLKAKEETKKEQNASTEAANIQPKTSLKKEQKK